MHYQAGDFNVKNAEKDTMAFLKEIMGECKKERKAKTKISNKQFAAKLEITENYLSALENGRVVPSLQLFLRYLLLSGFDVSPLTALQINDTPATRAEDKTKIALIQKIHSATEGHVAYLAEQSKVADLFDLQIKPKRR